MLSIQCTRRSIQLLKASSQWLTPSLQQAQHSRPFYTFFCRRPSALRVHHQHTRMVGKLSSPVQSKSKLSNQTGCRNLLGHSVCCGKLSGQSACGLGELNTVSRRCRAFSTQSSLKDAESNGKSMLLQLGPRQVQVPLIWLRDHCRCQLCYNATTYQKNVASYSLDNLAVLQASVEGDTLSVTWQDGHNSQYSLQWLDDNFDSPGTPVERFLWDGPRINEQPVPSTEFDQHVNSDEGLKNTLKNILKYGFCVVDGAPATMEGTLSVTDRISFPLETVYGRTSVMVSGEMDHSDTAYTSLPLGAHTDLTYYTLPAGMQVFHCFSHGGEGGETLLVDGFQAAEKLRRLHPSYFNTLVNTTIPHEYIEGSHYHLYSLATVLSVDKSTGDLTQIRFNPYDRAALSTVPPEDIPHFYDSYEALTNIIRSQESEFWIKLKPGMVLLVDNWRVMHGRSSFTGRRVLSGLYLPRDDWMSRARVMGLV